MLPGYIINQASTFIILGESFSRGRFSSLLSRTIGRDGFNVNMTTRVIKKLTSSSLRYWIIEYMRIEPKDRKFSALVPGFIEDRAAAILIMEVIVIYLMLA